MFIVLEIQTSADGKVGTLISSFEDRLQADSAYHMVLASAAVSQLRRHAAVLLTDEGAVQESQCYEHGD